MLVLRNARVVAEVTPGFEGEFADIVIDDKRIVALLPAKTAKAREEDIYDMSGKTVLPGLIDAHLHLDLCGINTFEENVQPDSYRTMRALSLAQDNLRKGYTTIRDLGDRNNIIISLAKAIDEELVEGPDILASGRILSPTEAGNNFFDGMYLEADSPLEYRRAVRTQWQSGAQWIKFMGTGAIMNPGAEPGAAIICEDELQAMVDAATKLNLPVAGHVHGAAGIKMAIRCGVRTIEHSSLMDEECIRMYKDSPASFIIPTFAPMTHFLMHADQHPAHYVEKSRKYHAIMVEGHRCAYEEGLKLGFGTDAGVYVGSHGDGIFEFHARVRDGGFRPLDCIVQATKNNAEILMIDDAVGTIEIGKRANLLAVNGNPDQCIDALEDVALVLKAGKIVTV